ncbi:uncharacterized protein EDB93DRAFT_1103074 [Suillus bovinus]|uniref:uncharacterized protein n=1 Tax=Suillus bovinus TaxID=48563 RepID=UPI001B87CFBE|nr:uncharacterized protein EDB93DRAFT_1103074 [Suillus bovinus]KAG2151639.1 hypothetical protein EDB93DRAFT_1103074 [Suillus bovinus]
MKESSSHLKVYVTSHPDILGDPTRWIEGMGWDQNKWPGAQYPYAFLTTSKDDFGREPLLRGRRIPLAPHGTPSWEDIDGGLIIRDEHGKLTGIFVDNAMDRIPSPPFSETRAMEYFTRTTSDALVVGLTSVHDAFSVPEEIQFYRKLSETQKIPLRLYFMGSVNSDEYWGSQIPRLIQHGFGGRWIVCSVKLFADGALGSFGAALLDDNPSTSGIMRVRPEALTKLVMEFSTDGWQVNVHGIGDRANHIVLDIYEDMLANASFSINVLQPRIKHTQILILDNIKRTGKLGGQVTCSMLRIDWIQRESKARMRIELYSSTHPSASRMLKHSKGMTLDIAYASFSEDILGSLSIGKIADFVVLDREIMMVPIDDIPSAKGTATVIDGEVVYGNL